MTKLLEQAVEQVRELPEEQQNAAADALFAFISSDERDYILSPQQAAEVRRIRERLHSRVTRLACTAEVEASKKKTRA